MDPPRYFYHASTSGVKNVSPDPPSAFDTTTDDNVNPGGNISVNEMLFQHNQKFMDNLTANMARMFSQFAAGTPVDNTNNVLNTEAIASGKPGD